MTDIITHRDDMADDLGIDCRAYLRNANASHIDMLDLAAEGLTDDVDGAKRIIALIMDMRGGELYETLLRVAFPDSIVEWHGERELAKASSMHIDRICDEARA